MALNIIGTKNYIPKWNDNDKAENPISMDISYLTQQDYWIMMGIAKDFNCFNKIRAEQIENKKNNKEDFKLDEKIEETTKNLMIKVSTTLTPVLKKYVKNVKNFTIDNKPVEPELIAQHPLLIGLMSELMTQLISFSTFSEEDKKK